MSTETTNTRIYTETLNELANEGKYKESMADIIKRVVIEWKKQKNA